MNRTALRLTGFAILLAVLFTGGWAAGAQFPVDDDPAQHQMDHGTDASHGAETSHEIGTDPATDAATGAATDVGGVAGP